MKTTSSPASQSTLRSLGTTARTAVVLAGVWLGSVVDLTHAGGPVGAVHGPDVNIETVAGGWKITAPDGSIINYTSFNIDQGEFVQFLQGSSDARVLNRINGGAPTIIGGELLADGAVYWVNPAGVFFTQSAVVDVAQIYAAAGDISDSNFLNNIDLFTGVSGDTFNFGTINAEQIHMIGRRVNNQGTLESGGGVITMVSGNSVYLQQFGDRVSVRVDGKTLTDRSTPYSGFGLADISAQPGVENAGTINNPGGTVTLGSGDLFFYALGVKNTGTINAEGGHIEMLASTGAIVNEGTLDASTAAGPGGSVLMQGPSVLHRGTILADAPGGDGSATLQGYFHTLLDEGSVVSVTGAGGGDGGTATIESMLGLTVLGTDSLVTVHRGTAGGADGDIVIDGGSIVVNGDLVVGPANAPSEGSLTIGSMDFLGSPLDLEVTDAGGDDSFFAPWFDIMTLQGDGNAAIRGDSLAMVTGDIQLSALRDVDIVSDMSFTGQNDLSIDATGTVALEGLLEGLEDLAITTGASIELDNPLHLLGDSALTAALIRLRGDEVVTGGSQTYNGNVIVGSHMLLVGTDVIMNGTVNSGSASLCATCPLIGFNRNLTIDGNARFNGTVGDTFAIRNLEVTGTTRMDGGLVRTNQSQTYGGNLTLGRDAELVSRFGGDIRFASAVNGAHDLDVNTAGATRFEGTVGGNAALGTVRTDAPGTTHIGADMNADRLIYGDRVIMENDATVTGTSLVNFRQTVDGHHALTVRSDERARFGGAIGGDEALARFTTDVRAAGDVNGVIFEGGLVHTTGDIVLNPNDRTDIPTVATLASTGDLQLVSDNGTVRMGRAQKLSVLGDLEISAGERAVLSDISTLGDLVVEADRIDLLARPAGFSVMADGTRENDLGVDYVAGGAMRFSTTPVLDGPGNVFFAAGNPDLALDPRRTDTIDGFDRSTMLLGETVLDLTTGTTRANLGEYLSEDPNLSTDADLEPYRVQALDRMGLNLRGPDAAELMVSPAGYRLANDFPRTAVTPQPGDSTSAHRLPIALVDRVVMLYNDLFDGLADGGDYEKTYRINAALTEAWDHFTSFTNGNPRYFRSYLRQSGEFDEALGYLDGLNDLFLAVWTMGATPREFRTVLDQVLAPLTPTEMGQASLEIAVGAHTIR